MKTSKIIMGCALAAGLMAFAPVQSQAGVVIENSVYAPANIKVSYSYVNSKGKIQKVSLTSKDILKCYNYPKGSQLAYYFGSGDVYVINKGAVLDDLTSLTELYVETDDMINSTTPGKIGGYKYAESGNVLINFYINGYINYYYSLGENDYEFEVGGTYSVAYSESPVESPVSNKVTINVSESLKISNLSGTGYNKYVSDIELPVSGTASASGSGKQAL